MKKLTGAIVAFSFFFLTACDSSKIQKGEDGEVVEDGNDNNDNDIEDVGTDEDEPENNDGTDDIGTDDDTVEPQQFQTGGINIFDKELFFYTDEFRGKTILGQGGFFGYSIFRFNEKYWGIGALHESIPPYDFEKATGVLYIFKGVQKIIDWWELDQAQRLTHPDLTINAGFSFTAAGACDINKDGFDDIVVSAHLAAYGAAYAAGELVVFYGSEDGWSVENSSISRLSETYIQQSDCISQSLVCGDIDGDGFDDVMAGGQNAGPNLTGGGSPGMVAFFKGSAEGLEENEYWVLTPLVEVKAQYFGSSMILEDMNGDDRKDLVVSGWGLKESAESDNTGGVYIYHGGTDWQKGPSETIFGTKDSQFGSVMKLVKVEGETLLGVIAPNTGKNGTIHFYDPSIMTEKFTVTVPATLDMGSNGGFSDFDTISNGTETILVAGGKYFKDGGRILCAAINPESIEELVECPWQPETTTGGFGYSVKNVGNIDAEGEEELVVGMPEYISTLTE